MIDLPFFSKNADSIKDEGEVQVELGNSIFSKECGNCKHFLFYQNNKKNN